MKLKTFLAALLISTPAYAQQIPFFSSPGVIDKTKWFIAGEYGSWQEDDCWWKPVEASADGASLKLMIQSKKDFTGVTNDIPNGLYGCGQLQSWTQQKYGTYTVSMKTASGSGLNSAFFLYDANTRDEIDLEFLGLHPTQLSLNYWVGGVNQSLTPVNLGFDASQAFHTYTLVWTPSSITWYAEGKLLFQTKAGAKLPTHLTRIYLDLWAGMPGWMGAFKYTAPVSAEYQWVSFTPYNPALPSRSVAP